MYSPLSEAKHALENSLKNLKAQTEEIAENEKRLAAAKEKESQLLSEKWDDEGMQIVKLGEAAARQRLLASRLEQGALRVDVLKAEVSDRANEAYRVFGNALTSLRDARQAKHLDRLQAHVPEDKRPASEPLALAFIKFASDIDRIAVLGDHAHYFIRSGAVRQGSEMLLEDIGVLEAELAR